MTSENIEAPPPFISIGLPTYNRPEYTRLALKSCLEQDYPRFEVIVSDDSKDDQIRRIAESFGSEKIRYFKNEPALGIPAKLNDLLDKAKGTWMVFLGDDDLFDPGYLSAIAALIRQHPDAALVHTRCRQIDEQGKLLHVDAPQNPSLNPAELLIAIFRPWYEMRVSITGFVFPVQNLKRLGGFLEFYMGYYTDNVAWAMLGAQGTSYFENTPLVSLRENPSSLSRAFISDHRRLISSREKLVEVVTRLFDGLPPGTSEAAGRAQFMECVLEDTRNFLDRMLVQTLKKTGGSTRSEALGIFLAVQSSSLPLFSESYFYRRFLYYRRISAWPAPLRLLALGAYRLYRNVRLALAGPKTLSEKAHYYRTHPPPKRS
jgi:glycosyltransferase involved in cell wall biosynthesis